MRGFLFGFILGIAAVPVGMYIYFSNGHPPVAVADRPFPLERQIVRLPLETRIETQVQQVAPIKPTAANLAAGAWIYRQRCVMCHGSSGHPAELAKYMYPPAPQLWERHRNGAVGVSDDPPGETYWKIANGIRLTGMPAFGKLLNNKEMWQVTLLLSNANRELPAGAGHVLRGSARVSSPRKVADGENRVKLQAEPAPAPRQNKD
ncbi:MAG TPA: cytochrome c [Candidatus Angelobacter sp.]|nr:cytochrome c [Candidatus Angelobacter sp.]